MKIIHFKTNKYGEFPTYEIETIPVIIGGIMIDKKVKNYGKTTKVRKEYEEVWIPADKITELYHYDTAYTINKYKVSKETFYNVLKELNKEDLNEKNRQA